MSGLQTWDSEGREAFNGRTTVVKFLGALSIGTSFTGSAQQGSFQNGNFTQYPQHQAFYARIDGGFDDKGYDADITIQGNTLTWRFPRDDTQNSNGFWLNRPNQVIIFGIR